MRGTYLPDDFGWALRRFFDKVEPLVERGRLWHADFDASRHDGVLGDLSASITLSEAMSTARRAGPLLPLLDDEALLRGIRQAVLELLTPDVIRYGGVTLIVRRRRCSLVLRELFRRSDLAA